MFIARSLIALGFIVAAPVLAQQTSDPTASPTVTKRDPNRMICERVEEIGTRLGGGRVCKTAAEWSELRQRARDMVDETQGRRTGNSHN